MDWDDSSVAGAAKRCADFLENMQRHSLAEPTGPHCNSGLCRPGPKQTLQSSKQVPARVQVRLGPGAWSSPGVSAGARPDV